MKPAKSSRSSIRRTREARSLKRSGILEKDASEERSSSPCEANPKEDSCSHSGGEDVSGDHRPGPGAFGYQKVAFLEVETPRAPAQSQPRVCTSNITSPLRCQRSGRWRIRFMRRAA